MRDKRVIAFIVIFLFPMILYAGDIKITVLYNNVQSNKELIAAWGFSCIIEGMPENILFDTGGDGKILLDNMKKLKINPKDIDIVILSHIHGDHVGGLGNFLGKNNKVTVYLPQSFPEEFKYEAEKTGAKVVSVHKSIGICKNVYSTGELGTGLKEQSLVLDTKNGLIVVTGCAHPGIVNIVKKAKSLLRNDVYLVLGGFHLMAYSEPEVQKIIKDLKELGIKKIGPSHCTGGRPIELFKEAWGEDFFDLGCGARIIIKND